MKRRFLALLLVLAMLLPMIPMGTLAEDTGDIAPAEETAEPQFSATASMTRAGLDGVEVCVTGNFQASEAAPVFVVAAYYDETGRMADSGYNRETNLNGKGSVSVYLEDTPNGGDISVFVLNKDLEPLTQAGIPAQWKQFGGQYYFFGQDRTIWSYDVEKKALEVGDKFDPYDDSEPSSDLWNPWDGYPWSTYADQAESLTIRGFKSIGEDAFRGFASLETVTLESTTLTEIKANAFEGVGNAQVLVGEGFDWTQLYISPEGNDVILNAKPTEETTTLEGAEPEATETTEETVPETTEETVPENTEETVPETTEETVPQQTEAAPEEALTPEEAAGEGYYIAPEGAQLLEEADLQEMAAFDGTDETAGNVHTASFTGLVPQKTYTFLASNYPGELGREPGGYGLQYIGIVTSDANGSASISYIPKGELGAIVQLYGPEALTLEAEQDYVTLKANETVTLRLRSNRAVTVEPVADNEDALNCAELEDMTWLISAKDDYKKELTEVKSHYITFVATDSSRQQATVKVRVDLIPESNQVLGASLGQNAVTHNYYSTEATPIPVFLNIQNPLDAQAGTQAAFDAGENIGMIESAGFADSTPQIVKDAFRLYPQDDHTLMLLSSGVDGGNINVGELTSTQAAGQAIDVKSLKSSYSVGIQLKIKGQEEPVQVTGTLKLNIQKKLPTLKAQTVSLNTYAKPDGDVTVTGGEVVSVLSVSGSSQVELGFDRMTGDVYAALVERPAKSGTVNLTAQVAVKGYNTPVTLKVPVKVDVKAPTFKLGKTSINLCTVGEQWVEIPIQCTTKGIDMEDLTFHGFDIFDASGASLGERYAVEYRNGSDTLKVGAYRRTDAEGKEIGRPAGKQTVYIRTELLCGSLRTPLEWKITINNQEPTWKPKKNTVVMNVISRTAIVGATVTGMSQEYEDVDILVWSDHYSQDQAKEFFDFTWYYDIDELKAEFVENECLYVDDDGVGHFLYEPEEYERMLGETYTFMAGITGTDQSKWAKFTLKITGEKPSVTVKASGTLDLNNDDSRVTLTPTYKNTWGYWQPRVTVTDGEGTPVDFNVERDGDKILLSRAPGAEGLQPGTYTAKLYPDWGGLAGEEDAAKVTFKVVAKTPTLKVTGKLDSSDASEWLHIASSYKHICEIGTDMFGEPSYEVLRPAVTLTTAGKNPEEVSRDLYSFMYDPNGGVYLYPITYGDRLLPAGKYTVTLYYSCTGMPESVTLSTTISVSQTAGTLKLAKSSVTLHPENDKSSTFVASTYTGQSGYAKAELFHADGKTPWGEGDQELLYVSFASANDGVYLRPTGNKPAKDTTLKVKLTPDSRIGKFSWLTVKVLGENSLNKKATLKVTGSLDPSVSYTTADIKVTVSGMDNLFEKGTLTLLESTNGKTYTRVDPADLRYAGTVSGNTARLEVWNTAESGLNPAKKYRVRIDYGDYVTGTADVKVAYAKNKFTLEKAPTLYKKDYRADMDIRINQQDRSQEIASVSIKGKTNFTLEKAIGESMNDWTIRYTGDLAKLKTTTLTLQIFLKGNNTQKPNATVNVKVTVK